MVKPDNEGGGESEFDKRGTKGEINEVLAYC